MWIATGGHKITTMNRREFVAAALVTVSSGSVRAAKQQPFRASLIGGTLVDAFYLAGIAIELEPGWKTYWRMPGEAGIPPDFDWKRSTNVAAIEVLFPAPHRFVDAGGEGVGYKTAVVFPVKIRPKDAESPVTLALDLFFAVCQDVCIPAQAMSELVLGAATPDPVDMLDIEAALAEVPKAGAAGVVMSATIAEREGIPALVLGLADDPANPVQDVFIEADSAAYFRAPRKDGTGVYLPIDGLKSPSSLRGKELVLTITRVSGALEQRVTVN